eukprot:1098725-Pyramimonas_sp.AAC.1
MGSESVCQQQRATAQLMQQMSWTKNGPQSFGKLAAIVCMDFVPWVRFRGFLSLKRAPKGHVSGGKGNNEGIDERMDGQVEESEGASRGAQALCRRGKKESRGHRRHGCRAVES